MKTCVIDCGGGLRDIYGAGVFDYCIDNDITFDMCIGISAGSANIASFNSGQRGRNYNFYHEYAFRKEYMSFDNVLKKKFYLDLDYVYGKLSNSNGEDPFDYDKFSENESEIYIIATNAKSGKPEYFYAGDMKKDNYWHLKASSCIPMICSPAIEKDNRYFDGGISDPIPLKFALEKGCEKIVVIWTKPIENVGNFILDEMVGHAMKKKFPKVSDDLLNRKNKVEKSLNYAKKLRDDGKVLIVSPESIGKMSTLTKDKEALDKLYKIGYNDAEKIKDFI
ncbi:MAG: patatin family protein [Clostridiaceae bacterium]|nr:patatin family protein [Clostridiaceae bacterium]MDY5888915.1 patatin family protein [Oscillospiraceae bacterium]